MIDPGDDFRIRYALLLGCGAGLGAAVGTLIAGLLPHTGAFQLRVELLGLLGTLAGIRLAEHWWWS